MAEEFIGKHADLVAKIETDPAYANNLDAWNENLANYIMDGVLQYFGIIDYEK